MDVRTGSREGLKDAGAGGRQLKERVWLGVLDTRQWAPGLTRVGLPFKPVLWYAPVGVLAAATPESRHLMTLITFLPREFLP